MMKKKACFLDRDGVINELVDRGCEGFTAPWDMSEFLFKPRIHEAIASIKKAGFLTFVVTNQPGILDGDMLLCDLEEMHRLIKRELGIDEIVFALDKHSEDYKPKSGMIHKLIEKYDIDTTKSFMIGDRGKDMLAGAREGLATIYIGDKLKAFEMKEEYSRIRYPRYVVKDVYEASLILAKDYAE